MHRDWTSHDGRTLLGQARDHFSDAVNRAAFGGEITYVTRGRNQQRAAAIVPADLVERYEGSSTVGTAASPPSDLPALTPGVSVR